MNKTSGDFLKINSVIFLDYNLIMQSSPSERFLVILFFICMCVHVCVRRFMCTCDGV